MLSLFAASASFSAPQSLTRRDMMIGMGASAAAMFPTVAFAAESRESKAAADAKKQAETNALLKELAESSKLEPQFDKLRGEYYNPNGGGPGKSLQDTNNRKPSDPNPTRPGGDKDAFISRYGY